MARDKRELLRRLDRPPAGHNWVRFVWDSPEKTAKAILSFLKGIPPFTYRPGSRAIKDRVELGIDLATAVKLVTEHGPPAGRLQNREFVEAFFQYDEVRRYSSSNPVEFENGLFRVSREISVPIAPLSVIRERGKFVPLFACGWSSNPLSVLQRRLLMTIIDDAFLSLTDYQNSPAEILFFPKGFGDEKDKRVPELWTRGDYELLSRHELERCVDT